MSNSLDPDQARRLVGPDLGQNVCKGYQQTTLLVKELRLLIYLSKALTFLIYFLYNKKCFFIKGVGWIPLATLLYEQFIHLTSQSHINHFMPQHTAFEQSFCIL